MHASLAQAAKRTPPKKKAAPPTAASATPITLPSPALEASLTHRTASALREWPQSSLATHSSPRATELLEFSVSVRNLQHGSGPCNPMALLIAGGQLLGTTEWADQADQAQFSGLICVDAASIPGGPAARLVLQVRHVHDAYFDALEAAPEGALEEMPLLGQASFKLTAALSAAVGGDAFELPLVGSSPADRVAAEHAPTAFVRARSAAGWATNWLTGPHTAANFRFGGATGAAPAAGHVRVCEHSFSCTYGTTLPLAVLRMLHAHAELAQQLGGTPPALGDGGADGGDDSAALLGSLEGEHWARLASWLSQWGGYGGEYPSGVAATRWRPSGFKRSVEKKLLDLAPMPTNLHLAVLEVADDDGLHPTRVYPSVTMGAPSAHALGFKGGGAHTMGEQLRGASAGDASLALSYAQRSALLTCQGYAALAASFAVACSTHAARRDRSFFAQLGACGFLLQAESLLNTRGDEWGMLQDTRVACRLLQAVRLTVLPTGGECKEGVALRGGAACPVLAFNATELGFADAEAAASLGLAPGVMVGVTVALVTQGVSLEQSWASLWQNNLGAQRELNEIAINALAGYAKKVHAAATTALGAPASPRAAALQQQQQALLERARRLHAEDEPKNVELLLSVAMLTRSLRGGRLTMCKSGKDRTSMSVTLEHGRLLRDHHGLDDAEATHAVGVLRRHGVRRENVRRNMGSRCYAFNDAQQWFLPPALQPPKGAARGGTA